MQIDKPMIFLMIIFQIKIQKEIKNNKLRITKEEKDLKLVI